VGKKETCEELKRQPQVGEEGSTQTLEREASIGGIKKNLRKKTVNGVGSKGSGQRLRGGRGLRELLREKPASVKGGKGEGWVSKWGRIVMASRLRGERQYRTVSEPSGRFSAKLAAEHLKREREEEFMNRQKDTEQCSVSEGGV